jgi:hypothetical protein
MKKLILILMAVAFWGAIASLVSACANKTPTCPTYVGGSTVKHGKKVYFSTHRPRK